MNVICRLRGHRPTLTDSIYDPAPEQCVELDVVDLPTLHFTIEAASAAIRNSGLGSACLENGSSKPRLVTRRAALHR